MKRILLQIVTLFCLPMAMFADDVISLDVVKKNETTWTLSVDLTNATGAYAGFQMDFVLPTGFTPVTTSLVGTTRLSGLTLQANNVAGNNLRVVAYASLKTKKITEHEGTIFTMDITSAVPPTVGNYDITAKNIRFSTGTTETVLPAAYKQFSVSDATTYTLTYHNGNEVYYSTQVAEGASIPSVEDPAPKTGYSFCGWGEVPEKMPARNLDLYATWCPIHYNVFYLVDADTVHTEQVAYGSPLPNYEPDGKEGYAFAGWQDAPLSMPANDISLVATWQVNKYTVNYYVDNELVHTEQVAYGDTLHLYNYSPEAGRVVSAWEGDTYETMPAYDVMYTATTSLKGDVNLDGTLNTADIVAIYNFISTGAESGIVQENADVNGDGVVNTADVAAVYNIIGGSAN